MLGYDGTARGKLAAIIRRLGGSTFERLDLHAQILARWRDRDFAGTLEAESQLLGLLEADADYGARHPDTLKLKYDRAVTLMQLERHDEAAAEFRAAAITFEQVSGIGPYHDDTIAAWFGYAHCLAALERLEEALAALGDVFSRCVSQKFRSARVDHHLEQVTRYQAVLLRERMNRRATEAGIAGEAGRLEEALDLWTLSIEDALANPDLGLHHAHTTLLLAKRAKILELLGRTDEALRELGRVLDASASLPLEDHVIAAYGTRAELLIDAGELDGALSDFASLVIGLSDSPMFGPGHEMTQRVRLIRANHLRSAGRHDAAIAEFRRVIRHASPRDAGLREMLFARAMLAYNLIMVRQYWPALEELEAATRALERRPRADFEWERGLIAVLQDGLRDLTAPAVAILVEEAARALEEERYAHALQHWTAVREMLKRHPDFGDGHADTRLALENRVATLVLMGRRDTAAADWAQAALGTQLPLRPRFEFSATIPHSGYAETESLLREALREYQLVGNASSIRGDGW